jgi:hypothetical protein
MPPLYVLVHVKRKIGIWILLVFGIMTGIACTSSKFPQKIQKKKARKSVFTPNLPNYDRRLFNFGVNMGVLYTGLAVRPNSDLRTLLPDTLYSVHSVWEPGFTMGIESSMRLGEHWWLKFTPTLSLASRVMEFERPGGKIDQFTWESTLAEFPVYFKFKSVRINNFATYLIGGGKYVFDLSSKLGAEDASMYPIKLRPHDFMVELGIGFDFYLPYFKFSPQLKTSWGIMNLHFPESNLYNRSVDQLYTRGIFISFVFE